MAQGAQTTRDTGSNSRTGWRLILRSVRARRAGLILAVSTGLAWTAAKVSTGLIVKTAVDRGIESNDMAALVRWSLTLGIVAVFSATFTGLRRYLAFREARWIEADLRDRLFAHLQRLHFAFHDRSQTGQLMSRANTDLQQVQAFVVMIPLTISTRRVAAARKPKSTKGSWNASRWLYGPVRARWRSRRCNAGGASLGVVL